MKDAQKKRMVAFAGAFPTEDVIPLSHRRLWLRLPGVAEPVRVETAERAPQGVLVDCELRWLPVGEPVEIELAPGEWHRAVMRWVGAERPASQPDSPGFKMALAFGSPLDGVCDPAFFARASALSGACEEAYEDYAVLMRPRRRRSAFFAALAGLALGIAILQVPAVQALVARAASYGAAQMRAHAGAGHSVPRAHK